MSTIGLLCQDFIVMGAMRSPGRATVRRASSPRKWDKRAGYGTSGATLVYMGLDLAKFEIEIYIWEPSQLVGWILFAAANLRKAPPGMRPLAVGIGHPLINTAPLSISSVVVEDVTQWDPDDFGGMTCIIKVEEYRAALPGLGKALPGIPALSPTVATAVDAADIKIQALEAEAKALNP